MLIWHVINLANVIVKHENNNLCDLLLWIGWGNPPYDPTIMVFCGFGNAWNRDTYLSVKGAKVKGPLHLRGWELNSMKFVVGARGRHSSCHIWTDIWSEIWMKDHLESESKCNIVNLSCQKNSYKDWQILLDSHVVLVNTTWAVYSWYWAR